MTLLRPLGRAHGFTLRLHTDAKEIDEIAHVRSSAGRARDPGPVPFGGAHVSSTCGRRRSGHVFDPEGVESAFRVVSEFGEWVQTHWRFLRIRSSTFDTIIYGRYGSFMVNSGLEGVVAATTRLSEVDGERGELIIGGFSIGELAADATFEETTWLLWHGDLPSAGAARRVPPPNWRASAPFRRRPSTCCASVRAPGSTRWTRCGSLPVRSRWSRDDPAGSSRVSHDRGGVSGGCRRRRAARASG